MAILKKGEYKGEYIEDEITYYMFSPDQLGTEGQVKYFRIGDASEEFGSNRNYILRKVNKEEQNLIDKKSNL